MTQYAKTLLAAATATALLALAGQAQASVMASSSNTLSILAPSAWDPATAFGNGFALSYAKMGSVSNESRDPTVVIGTAVPPLTTNTNCNGGTNCADGTAGISGAAATVPSLFAGHTDASVNLNLSASESGQAQATDSWDVYFTTTSATTDALTFALNYGLDTQQTGLGAGDSSSASSKNTYRLFVEEFGGQMFWDTGLVDLLTGTGTINGGSGALVNVQSGTFLHLGVSLYSEAKASYTQCVGPNCGGPTQPPAVPEPATLALLGLGLAGLGLMRRRVR